MLSTQFVAATPAVAAAISPDLSPTAARRTRTMAPPQLSIRPKVEERNQAIEGDYGVICDLYPPFRDVATLEEFKWARMCVCSRNFGLDIGGLRTSALVPYADMLNHYR